MGAGLRPKGSFPYAALRYSVCWQDVPCYGKPEKCPDKELCEDCVHFVGCKDRQSTAAKDGDQG